MRVSPPLCLPWTRYRAVFRLGPLTATLSGRRSHSPHVAEEESESSEKLRDNERIEFCPVVIATIVQTVFQNNRLSFSLAHPLPVMLLLTTRGKYRLILMCIHFKSPVLPILGLVKTVQVQTYMLTTFFMLTFSSIIDAAAVKSQNRKSKQNWVLH